MGNLSNLEILFLSDNQLSGPIPPELGKLSNLERLFLMDNQLSGAIPSELGKLSNLVQVFLSGNPNLCMPVALKDWRHYYTAGVAKCNKKTNGVEWDRAPLVALYLATDGGNWKDNTNWLSDKPLNEWYGVYTNAQGRVDTLALIENYLSGPIPSELGNLSDLEWLNLGNNQLSGAIPPEIGNLSDLDGCICTTTG